MRDTFTPPSIDSLFVYTDEDLTLPLDDEIALIASAQGGDTEALWALALAYGPAIRSAVSKFASGVKSGRDPYAAGNGTGTSAFEVEDAQSVAFLGFMETVREHDPAMSPRLAGTVRRRIARELSDLYAETMPFTVPERTLSRFYGILREADGDDVAAEALAPEKGMSRETFRDVLAAVRGTSTLDAVTEAPTTAGGSVRSRAKHETIEGATPIFSSSPIADAEDAVLVRVAFESVDDDEERICRLAYGFTEYDPQPDAEIAHRMGLTRPTVQRKRGKALGSMRKALGVTHG